MSISAGTSIVGGTMQAIAAQREQADMFRQYQAELRRQGQYQQQAMDIWNPAVQALSSQSAAGQIAQGAGQRQAAYGQVNATPLTTGPGPSAADRAYLQMTGADRAALGGYQDWQNQRSIDQLHTGQQLGQVSNFASGTASVFPYRMYQAQHSMDELAFWGQMISSMGGAASNYQQLFGSPQAGAGQQLYNQNAALGQSDIGDPGAVF